MEDSTNHRCFECKKEYSTTSSLWRHMRMRHNLDNNTFLGRNRLKCSVCFTDLPSKQVLIKHLEDIHSVILETESLTFQNEESFCKWKAIEEKNNNCHFVKNSGGRKRTSKGKQTTFYCHRSGYYKSEGSNKRSIKVNDSNKINATCPALMKVNESNDLLSVKYVKTHVGHEGDLSRMRLSAEEKNSIASKMRNGMSITAILDEIRDSACGKIERIHLLTRRDLLNIRNEFHINTEARADPEIFDTGGLERVREILNLNDESSFQDFNFML